VETSQLDRVLFSDLEALAGDGSLSGAQRGGVQMRFGKVRPGEICPRETRVAEVCTGEFRPGEIRLTEICFGEVSLAKVCSGEGCPVEVSPGEVCPEEVCLIRCTVSF
jgi:hypothetical protein